MRLAYLGEVIYKYFHGSLFYILLVFISFAIPYAHLKGIRKELVRDISFFVFMPILVLVLLVSAIIFQGVERLAPRPV